MHGPTKQTQTKHHAHAQGATGRHHTKQQQLDCKPSSLTASAALTRSYLKHATQLLPSTTHLTTSTQPEHPAAPGQLPSSRSTHQSNTVNPQSQYLISPSQPQVATLLLSSGCHCTPMHTPSCALMVRATLKGCAHSQKNARPSESPVCAQHADTNRVIEARRQSA
jgi:hypothetical protein